MIAVGVDVSVLRTPAIISRFTALFSGSLRLQEKMKINWLSIHCKDGTILIDNDVILHWFCNCSQFWSSKGGLKVTEILQYIFVRNFTSSQIFSYQSCNRDSHSGRHSFKWIMYHKWMELLQILIVRFDGFVYYKVNLPTNSN